MNAVLTALLLLFFSDVQIVHIGKISRIDTTTGIITIKETVYPERRQQRGARGGPPSIGGPARGRGRRELVTKVFYSADTVFKSGGIADLKIGDSLKITGKPQKDDLVATRIEKLTITAPELRP